ncbi:MAG: histidine kinase N-terminal 7TM domain-containing protein [Methanosarcinaceae archaeon]|nr:histidine kinase N-terminal 7TM domain-containing protein [Methanosarcinaceae archaeon]
MFSALVSLFLAHRAHKAFDFRKVPFAKHFILLMFCMIVWVLTYAGELGFPDLETKHLCTRVQYLGIGLISTVWFLFAAEYCGIDLDFIRRYEKYLFIFPLLSFIAINTNKLHWLFYTNYYLDTSGSFPIIVYDHGPLFWAFYSYSMLLSSFAVFFFIRQFIYARAPYRAHAALTMIGSVLPLFGTLLYLADIGPFALIEPTPFLFNLTGMVIFLGVRKHKFLNLVPVAREYVIENMGDGYIVVNNEGTVLDINTRVLALAGKKRNEVLGKHLNELFGGQVELFRKRWGEEASLRDISIKTGGQTRFFELSASPIGPEVPSPLRGEGELILVRDVTETYRYGEALKEANKKIHLMSNVTRHDILNQVSVLSGYTELLLEVLPEETKSDARTGKYLKNFSKGIETIQNQILFTRDYQDLGVVSPVWQSVSDTAKEAAFAFSNSGVRFSIPEGGPEIYADPLLKKAIYNLFHNAGSHGGPSISEVSVSFRKVGDSAVIEVRDNGSGVPDAMKERIFEKSVGKNTGLGLFLVKEILSITGLEIKEVGREGEGAEFVITVPAGNWRTI